MILFEKDYAPTREIREMQWEEDKAEHQTKKTRESLGHAFCEGYHIGRNKKNRKEEE